MVFIVGFEDVQALDPQIVGRKFASLAQAAAEGFPVPEAVAIVTKAHGHYLATGGWPDGLREEVIETARRLDVRQSVSIRSSATREDLAGQSFAGQYRSFLEVDSERDILRRIEECWESAGSETVRSYLRAVNLQGSDTETPLLAVIIQRMVNASVAGVAFSRNPLCPDRKKWSSKPSRGMPKAWSAGTGRLAGRVFTSMAECPSKAARLPTCGCPARRRGARSPGSSSGWRNPTAASRSTWSGRSITAKSSGCCRSGRLRRWRRRGAAAGGCLDPQDRRRPLGGRLEPFMAEVMLSHAPRFDLSRIARIAGITPVLPALTVINGYLYVNCDSIRRVIAHIPRPLRFKDLATLLPAGSRLSDIPPPGAWTLARIFLRIILLPLKEPGMIPFICLQSTPRAIRRLRARMGPGPGPASAAPAMLERLQADLETLALIQVNNQWPYFHATLFTWVLRWLAVDRLRMTGAGFLVLISQGSDNVTIGIEHWFRKTALHIGSDPGLEERFLSEPAAELAFSLPAELQAEVDAFLQRYGFRSRHRTLLIKRWAEAPEEVVGILQSLVRHPRAGGTAPKANLPVTEGDSPGMVFRRVLRFLAGVTRRFLDLREELRFLLDEALFRIRRDLLALGRLSGMDETIFFPKTVGDRGDGHRPARAHNGRDHGHSAPAAVSTPVEPGTFWVDGRPEYDFCAGGTVLRGIGTSLGRVTGRAVIVEDPAAVKIRRGDVVVARHTDPGWTPIFSVIGGIVMEEGGLLNHCSIVARELGIPSIVGVSRATQLIPEGARVTIDGGAGMVRIEEG